MLEPHDEKNVKQVRWSYQESIELIEAVKDQPSLYDPNDKRYKLLKFTENIWSTMDIKFKKPPGASKERWGTLRSIFRKEQSERGNQSRWKLYSDMKFIANFQHQKGPSLKECIQKALGKQYSQRNGQKIKVLSDIELPEGIRYDVESENESISLQYNYEEEQPGPSVNKKCIQKASGKQYSQSNTQKIEVLSDYELPDGIRYDAESENESISLQYNYEEEQPGPSYRPSPNTYNDPKLEQYSENQFNLPPMSTPKIMKRNREPFCAPHDSSVIRYGQVKIRKISKEPLQSFDSAMNTVSNKQKLGELTEVNQMNISRVVKRPMNHVNPCTCNADCDVMFFQSLLPDVKKLAPEKNLIFKIRMQETLKELIYPSDECRKKTLYKQN